MYFVCKGDCITKLFNSIGREYLSQNLLDEGQHFGEISLLYNCPRTATVISRNFNTMGRLSYDRYREVISEFADFQKYLKTYIFIHYKDERKEFLLKMISQIEYFKGILTSNSSHDLIFQLKSVTKQEGEMILREHQLIEELYIIEYGCVEVFTECEGHEYIIDRLYRGSIINSISIMRSDSMCVNMRASSYCKLLMLTDNQIDSFCDEHPHVEKELMKF